MGVFVVNPYRAAQAGGQQEKTGRVLGLALHYELLGEAADGGLHLGVMVDDRLRPLEDRTKLLRGVGIRRSPTVLSSVLPRANAHPVCARGRLDDVHSYFVHSQRDHLCGIQAYLDRQDFIAWCPCTWTCDTSNTAASSTSVHASRTFVFSLSMWFCPWLDSE